MNPLNLSASELMIWGFVLHLIADVMLQSSWMADNKMERRRRIKSIPVDEQTVQITKDSRWWDRHPAAYVHAGIHVFALSFIFGWAGILLGIAHLIIDCRWIVAKWSKLVGQTPSTVFMVTNPNTGKKVALMDMGTIVRMGLDQVFHIVCIAVAALLIA